VIDTFAFYHFVIFQNCQRRAEENNDKREYIKTNLWVFSIKYKIMKQSSVQSLPFSVSLSVLPPLKQRLRDRTLSPSLGKKRTVLGPICVVRPYLRSRGRRQSSLLNAVLNKNRTINNPQGMNNFFKMPSSRTFYILFRYFSVKNNSLAFVHSPTSIFLLHVIVAAMCTLHHTEK
jgi:hypothetical protein